MGKIELIDRAALVKDIVTLARPSDSTTSNELSYALGYSTALLHVKNLIQSTPTIDAAPVRRGEWARYNLTSLDTDIEWYRLRCTQCGLMPVGDIRSWNFCPKCGADMRPQKTKEE